MENPEQITYFAETDARNKRIPFGIKAKDRSRHMYVIGKTGMGKSTLLENLAVQDLRNGNGVCFMDPHGKTADLLLEYIPKERINDVVYFAPFDTDFPISFNVMEDVGYDKRHLVVSGLMSTFKKIWQDAWSARMEYILSNTLLALLEYPDSTLLSVNKMLSDKNFRQKVVDNITDASVKSFWVDEFAKYTERFAAEATPAIQNKIGQFTSNPLIRNIVGQPNSSFDIRELMDQRKIVIINLSKGRIGEINAQLLGSMIVTKIYLAAMSRADTNEEDLKKLPNFYLFVDEFQSFANESFADILSEARKYKLNLTIAHQYIEQMPEEVRAAVFGNVGTFITFRVGATDAEYLEKEFAPVFLAQDIVNLGFTQTYLRLMIDGIGSQPFSARTLPPIAKEDTNYVKEIIEASRKQYAQPRDSVEARVKELLEEGRDAPKKTEDKKPDFNKKNSFDKPKSNYDNKPRENKPQNQSAPKNYPQNNNSSQPQQQSQPRPQPTSPRPMIDEKTRRELEESAHRQMMKKQMEELPPEPEISLEEESLSLKSLESKKRVFQDPKQISSENKNSLKNALAAVLANMPENKAKNETQAQALASTPQAKSNEISSDELKEILDVKS
ncbi:MAG: type IV secretion system DNA-binding domain-containing protein [Candidatus Paceibacterota bacterium]